MMGLEQIIESLREALTMVFLTSGLLLLVALLVGVASGVLQTVTQVHDHAISFVPKFFAIGVALALLMPWFMEQLLAFSRLAFSGGLF